MKQEKYQGWTNYETWATILWIDNEESTYNYVMELAEEFKGKKDGVYDFAEELKNFIEENTPELKGLYGDLLNAAISEINFRELAEYYIGQ